MVDDGREPAEDYADNRDRLLRQATLYSAGFFGAALVIALAGSALIAWVLTRLGLPFRATWAVVAACVILVPAGIHVYAAVRRRRRPGGAAAERGGSESAESDGTRGEREEGRDDGR